MLVHSLRPILCGNITHGFVKRSLRLFGSVRHLSNFRSLFNNNNNQLGFILGSSSPTFGKHNLLINDNKVTEFKLFSSTGIVHNVSSNQDSDQEEEKKIRRGLLSENSIRRDRQLSVQSFRKILFEKGDGLWTPDDWVQVGEQLSSQLTSPWEVMCMHTLMIDRNLTVGRSLMKFLEGQPKPPGPVITTFYIGLLGKTSQGDQEQELELKKYYDELVSVTEVFNAASIEILVEGLSHTKYYRECVRLLEMCKLTSPPGTSILRNMLMGALRNGDMELCTNVLHHFEEAIEPSQLSTHAPLIIDIAIASENPEGLLKIFDFMQKHNLSLVRNHLETVVESFQRNDPDQWKGFFGFVNYKSGKCSICGHQFPRIHLEPEDFKAIQSAFLDQVIVSDNIFFKTSPDEVQNFIQFVDKFGPFDVVIDGLNALYAANRKKPEKETFERLVSHYCESDKRVLVLGSKVLRPYIKRLGNLKPKPAVYMASTTRADDAFFLYAALRSGMKTVIVSADKLRDHKFRLDPQLQHIFHRWLMSNRVYSFVNPKTGAISPKQHMFNLGPIQDEHGWHIPVNDVDIRNPFGRQGILCLRHGTPNFERLRERSSTFNKDNFKSRRVQRNSSSPSKEWYEL